MCYCALWLVGTTTDRIASGPPPLRPWGGWRFAAAMMIVAVLVTASSAHMPLNRSTSAPRCLPDQLDCPAWFAAADCDRPPLSADDDSQAEDDDDRLTPCIEELFLGTVVYPQEQNELQFTWGLFHSVETDRDWQLPFEVEYGITDRFQVGLECPAEFYSPDEPFRGTRNLGVNLYYNLYSGRQTGRGLGVGFGWGAPVDAPRDESRYHVYEPYFVAFQQLDRCAVNFSAGLEIKDPLTAGEATEDTGELALALIGPCEGWTPLLEAGVEIAPDDTAIRLAPGLYLHQVVGPVDVAISLPIGLAGDAPKLGVFLMAIVEIEPEANGAESARRR